MADGDGRGRSIGAGAGRRRRRRVSRCTPRSAAPRRARPRSGATRGLDRPLERGAAAAVRRGAGSPGLRSRAGGRWRARPSKAEGSTARGATGYHDHNWGRWRWGDDVGWEWGCFRGPASGRGVRPQPDERPCASGGTSRPLLVAQGPGCGGPSSAAERWSSASTACSRAEPRRIPGSLAALHGDRAAPRAPRRACTSGPTTAQITSSSSSTARACSAADRGRPRRARLRLHPRARRRGSRRVAASGGGGAWRETGLGGGASTSTSRGGDARGVRGRARWRRLGEADPASARADAGGRSAGAGRACGGGTTRRSTSGSSPTDSTSRKPPADQCGRRGEARPTAAPCSICSTATWRSRTRSSTAAFASSARWTRIARMFAAIEILLDCSARAPALQRGSRATSATILPASRPEAPRRRSRSGPWHPTRARRR